MVGDLQRSPSTCSQVFTIRGCGNVVVLPVQKGLLLTSSGPIEESEDESNMEDLDQPTDFKDLPVQVNWNSELPANIQVPRVDVHSLILDFSAVSFLDISALKGLKAVKQNSSVTTLGIVGMIVYLTRVFLLAGY